MTTETMERTDLDGLIARLENAEGPDAELDRDIYVVLLKPYSNYPVLKRTIVSTASPITASIDAALTLVKALLPGWNWILDSRALPRLRCKLFPIDVQAHDDHELEGHANTMPRAILIALLHALKSQ